MLSSCRQNFQFFQNSKWFTLRRIAVLVNKTETDTVAVDATALAVATVVAETATAVDALGSEQELEAVVAVKILAPMIAAQAAHRRATGAKHEDNPTNLRINLAKASVAAKQIEATTNHPRVDSRAAETVARIESKNLHSSSLTVAGGENTP